MFLKKIAMGGAIAMLSSTVAFAECSVSGKANILGNDFPALQAVTAAAGTCGDVTINLNKDYKDIMVAGLSG